MNMFSQALQVPDPVSFYSTNLFLLERIAVIQRTISCFSALSPLLVRHDGQNIEHSRKCFHYWGNMTIPKQKFTMLVLYNKKRTCTRLPFFVAVIMETFLPLTSAFHILECLEGLLCLHLVTRDTFFLQLASSNPEYLVLRVSHMRSASSVVHH